eukprot:7440-Rhodomonas_salina.4
MVANRMMIPAEERDKNVRGSNSQHFAVYENIRPAGAGPAILLAASSHLRCHFPPTLIRIFADSTVLGAGFPTGLAASGARGEAWWATMSQAQSSARRCVVLAVAPKNPDQDLEGATVMIWMCGEMLSVG